VDEAVGDHHVLGAEDGFEHARVRVEAAGEEDRVLRAEERREFFLDLPAQILRAADEPHARHAVAAFVYVPGGSTQGAFAAFLRDDDALFRHLGQSRIRYCSTSPDVARKARGLCHRLYQPTGLAMNPAVIRPGDPVVRRDALLHFEARRRFESRASPPAFRRRQTAVSASGDRPHRTQAEAAEILEVDQPKVSALTRGRLAGFSLDRLVRFLILVGSEVEIVVRPRASGAGRARVMVA
jgi:hypothetical protein